MTRIADEAIFRAATEADRIGAYENVFEVWPCADELGAHVAKRLASPQHQKASWFVGVHQGKVVTSLGCYSFNSRIDDRLERTVAIGAVHTPSSYRGQGLASRLFAFVESVQQANGVKLMMLFSDIDPKYYERLGYQVTADKVFKLDLKKVAGDTGKVVEASIAREEERDTIAHQYDSCRMDQAFSCVRDADNWELIANKDIRDKWYWIYDNENTRVGYAAIGEYCIEDPTERKLRDYGSKDPKMLPFVIRSIARHQAELGMSLLTGWLPQEIDLEGIEFVARKDEITMFKLLDSTPIDDSLKRGSNWMPQIDHV